MTCKLQKEDDQNSQKMINLQKQKACLVAKNYRERKRLQKQEIDQQISKMQNENKALQSKIECLNAVRVLIGFELLKNACDTQQQHTYS